MATLEPWTPLSDTSVVMYLTLLVVVASVAEGQTTARCAWGHYYDRNVESCAPCSKICDAMTTTGAEHQCQSHCQDYLVSKSCRWDQYFDEVVRSCAPCSGLCGQQDTNDCFRKCDSKCLRADYLKGTNPSGNRPLDHHRIIGNIDDTSSWTLSSSCVQGIMASVAVGVIAITAFFRLLVYRAAIPGGLQPGDTEILERGQLAYPVQVSHEGEVSADIDISRQRMNVFRRW